jgi:hypothetical protein
MALDISHGSRVHGILRSQLATALSREVGGYAAPFLLSQTAVLLFDAQWKDPSLHSP